MTDQASSIAAEHHEDEGHSVAGWTGVIIALVGVTLGAFGLWFESLAIVWIGVALLVIGAIAWPVLKKLGFGPKEH